MFRIRDAAEAKKKCKRRQKRTDGKKTADTVEGSTAVDGQAFHTSQLVLSDEVEALPSHTIRCTGRVRGFAFDHSAVTAENKTSSSKHAHTCKALVSQINNSLEIYQLTCPSSTTETDEDSLPSKLSVIDLHGHRFDSFFFFLLYVCLYIYIV